MASQMTQRLLQQIDRRATLETQLLQEQRQLAQFAAEQQTLANKSAAVSAERERLMTLKQTLSQQHKAVFDSLRDSEAADKVKRMALSDELAQRIKEVNARVEEENIEWTTALTENTRLKEKISVITESITKGGEKFSELLDARIQETGGFEDRAAMIEAANAELRGRIDAAKTKLEEETPAFVEAKKECDTFAARFAEIQAQIKAAETNFLKAREENMKISKKIKLAEADYETALRACDKARLERNAEVAKEQQLLSETNSLVEKTQKLIDIAEALTQKMSVMHPDSATGCAVDDSA